MGKLIKGHLFSKGNILRPPTVRAKWSQMIFCHSTKLAQWVCMWTTFVFIPAVVWGESPKLVERGGLEEWSGDKFDRNLSKRAIDQDQEGQIDQFSNNNVHKLLKEDQEGHIHKYTN